MPSCSELRARARKALGGNIFAENWIWGLLMYLVATVIIGVTGMFVVGIILIGPVELGMTFYMIRMVRGTRPEFADPFRKAAEDMPGSIVTGLLVTLYTFLWSLLFIIPGFIYQELLLRNDVLYPCRSSRIHGDPVHRREPPYDGWS